MKEISLTIPRNQVVAIIGPSGCGKSTLLRCFNRMNDLIPVARVEGEVLFRGADLYAPDVDPVEVRRRIGMVFQKPNPFPKSIYDNVAFGLEINGYQGQPGRAGRALAPRRPPSGTRSRTACSESALGLSGGQQQRLCIARALAVEPEVLLMDEPARRSTRSPPARSRT